MKNRFICEVKYIAKNKLFYSNLGTTSKFGLLPKITERYRALPNLPSIIHEYDMTTVLNNIQHHNQDASQLYSPSLTSKKLFFLVLFLISSAELSHYLYSYINSIMHIFFTHIACKLYIFGYLYIISFLVLFGYLYIISFSVLSLML